MKIVLASTSLRRKELLKKAGIGFVIEEPVCDENNDKHKDPRKKVESLSFLKAVSVFKNNRDAIVIGADTVVVIDGKILGKPKDIAEAKEMLRLLSGRTHTVITGITVMTKDKTFTESVLSKVKFKKLNEEEIEDYVKGHGVLDKAGAYAIQDGKTVESFKGSYTNIVGLPMERTEEILKELGYGRG